MTPLFRFLLVAVLTALPAGPGYGAFAVRAPVGVAEALGDTGDAHALQVSDAPLLRARRLLTGAEATRHTAPIATRSVGAAALSRASARAAAPRLELGTRAPRRHFDSGDDGDAAQS